jgi:hypothetical protein
VGLGNITAVHQADFSSFGVSATPTVILVNRSGIVQKIWIGLLKGNDQNELLRAVGAPANVRSDVSETVGSPDSRAAAALLKRELSTSSGLQIIDSRSRVEFAKGHLAGARNILADEIELRARHEISKKQPVRLYCDYIASCQEQYRQGIPGLCEIEASMLKEQQYTDVRVVRATLRDLSLAGVEVINGDK